MTLVYLVTYLKENEWLHAQALLKKINDREKLAMTEGPAVSEKDIRAKMEEKAKNVRLSVMSVKSH
jgi:hypothetical protein